MLLSDHIFRAKYLAQIALLVHMSGRLLFLRIAHTKNRLNKLFPTPSSCMHQQCRISVLRLVFSYISSIEPPSSKEITQSSLSNSIESRYQWPHCRSPIVDVHPSVSIVSKKLRLLGSLSSTKLKSSGPILKAQISSPSITPLVVESTRRNREGRREAS
jgi:hypothetical protein